jgi:hypothetical protein
MTGSSTIWLGVLAALSAYLGVSIGRRVRAEEARRRARERQSAGTAFDVSVIAPQIQRLRQDHLAASRPRQHFNFYRASLIAAARRVVTDLPYFRDARSDEEMQKHDA